MASEAPKYFSARDLARIGITGLATGEDLARREAALSRMPLSTQRLLVSDEAPVYPTEPNILTWRGRALKATPLTAEEAGQLVGEVFQTGLYALGEQRVLRAKGEKGRMLQSPERK